MQLSEIPEIIEDLKSGKPIILIDDDDRENEGDIVVATERLTAEHINLMTNHARGLICVSISTELAKKLSLPLQVLNNNSPFNTPFTVSVDLLEVAGSGILAKNRAKTIKSLVDDNYSAADFVSPGNVFPLIANPAGVIARQGQTEGSYDLAKLAGLKPSAVICEILNTDGTMARGDDLTRFAKAHDLKICSVEQIIRYRVNHEILVKEVACKDLKTDFGMFKTFVFEDELDGKEHLALVYGQGQLGNSKSTVLARIHSECLTGDVFGSRRCDCGLQLNKAMKKIVEEGSGVVLYLRQEGRGIGLANKLLAYQLQDQGHDTVEANLKLGFAADSREFAVAAKIFNLLGVKEVRLMTNNPRKIKELAAFGIKVSERVEIISEPDPYSHAYLEAKRDKLGHML